MNRQASRQARYKHREGVIVRERELETQHERALAGQKEGGEREREGERKSACVSERENQREDQRHWRHSNVYARHAMRYQGNAYVGKGTEVFRV